MVNECEGKVSASKNEWTWLGWILQRCEISFNEEKGPKKRG